VKSWNSDPGCRKPSLAAAIPEKKCADQGKKSFESIFLRMEIEFKKEAGGVDNYCAPARVFLR